jgi:hypothetical protein
MAILQLKGGGVTQVDDADMPALAGRVWKRFRVGQNIYYAATAGKNPLLLHRFLMAATAGLSVDHINGDPLDNRRENLRLCTHAQNMANRRRQSNSRNKFKGVNKHPRARTWSVAIGSSSQGNRKYLGSFRSEEEAAAMYDLAAVLTYGEFACLNFPHVFPELNQRKA